MIPVPIPPDYQLAPFQRRLVVGPPDNDPTGEIRAVEAIVELVDDGHGHPQSRFHVLMELEHSDWTAWQLVPPPDPVRFWMVQLTPQMAAFGCLSEPTEVRPPQVLVTPDAEGNVRCPQCGRLCALPYFVTTHLDHHRYSVDGQQHAEVELTVVATLRDRYTQAGG